MKIGVFSTFMSPLATPQMIREFARRAEGMGLDSIWMGEHVALFDKNTFGYPGSKDGRLPVPEGGGLQTVRDWVLRLNAQGPDGLVNRKAPGKTPLLSAVRWRELAAMIERGPIPAVDGVVRWRLIDLAQWLYATYGIATSKQTLSRILRAMGYRKLSARPRHHAQDPEAAAAFKKVFPPAWQKLLPRMQAASR